MAALINYLRREPAKSDVTIVPHEVVRPLHRDVTATRALDTIYRNTGGRPLLVTVSTAHYVSGTPHTAACRANIGATTPPTGWASHVSLATGGNVTINVDHSQTFVVPALYYYRMVTTIVGAGIVTLFRWIEYEL